MSPPPAIVTEDLTKRYGDAVPVSGLVLALSFVVLGVAIAPATVAVAGFLYAANRVGTYRLD
ncbi:hypothetical protein [Haloarcula marina]|uniref:hypothetical protein n=1 Tax=Haloarcula marina TaxID=2961574 RepID=UPI0020B828E6|nr:hypothetical protein [Halomicroarcula marina]